MKSECLDYRQLPGQNQLFLSFLYDFEKVRDFYNAPALQDDAIADRVAQVLASPRFPRQQLIETLKDQAAGFGADREALANIGMLSEPDCVAVVTGQQVGLFGGPAYTVYKAATTIQLCQRLRDLGHKAVPVFWMASDDSDFKEVAGTRFVDAGGTPFRVSAGPAADPDQMAGTVTLHNSEELLEELDTRLAEIDRAEEMSALLRRHYRPGLDFRQAFGSWLCELFSDAGLICFDPVSARWDEGLGAFLEVAVSQRGQILGHLKERGQALQAKGFAPQVHVDDNESLLFWIEGNRRSKIRFENDYYSVKGRRQLRFDTRELAKRVTQEPNRFSVSALLRPILQDHLFPTALYVGGPAEIAYFSQVNAISHHWGLQMMIVPRAAFTVVDRKSQRLLQKHDLSVETVLRESPLQLAERILRRGRDGEILEGLDSLRAVLETRLEELVGQIGQADQSVAEMLRNSERKISYQLEKVHHRFVSNRQKQAGHGEKQIEYLLTRLRPLEHLQEREINFHQFLAEEGQGFLAAVIEQAQPLCHSHQVLYL